LEEPARPEKQRCTEWVKIDEESVPVLRRENFLMHTKAQMAAMIAI
jgi:hypothetical protein